MGAEEDTLLERGEQRREKLVHRHAPAIGVRLALAHDDPPLVHIHVLDREQHRLGRAHRRVEERGFEHHAHARFTL